MDVAAERGQQSWAHLLSSHPMLPVAAACTMPIGKHSQDGRGPLEALNGLSHDDVSKRRIAVRMMEHDVSGRVAGTMADPKLHLAHADSRNGPCRFHAHMIMRINHVCH